MEQSWLNGMLYADCCLYIARALHSSVHAVPTCPLVTLSIYRMFAAIFLSRLRSRSAGLRQTSLLL